MSRKKIFISVAILIIICIAGYFLFFSKEAKSAAIFATVKKSDFKIQVVTTGELRSSVRTKITAPPGLRQIGVYQIKISRLVPEGSIVKKGDFVASLDNSEVLTRMNDQQLQLNKLVAQFKQTKLDTMLKLRDARNKLVNLRFQLKQKKLEKTRSKYEAPAVIRQVELDYEETMRTLDQNKSNYKALQKQAQTKVQIVNADLQRSKNRMEKITDILQHMSINAPKDGMVIYAKDYRGIKTAVGSVIQIWGGGTVATLPDLTQMEVVTYVNEVDIRKVDVGQSVNIGLDAMPDKHLEGIVKNVASIGQQEPNSDAKVFEVIIKVLTKDSTLRPAMTASCKILSKEYKNGLQIPLEAIHNYQNRSYVFVREKGHAVKQEINVLAVNKTSALVVNGLSADQEVYLSLPSDTSGMDLIALNPKDKVIPQQSTTIDTSLLKQKGGNTKPISNVKKDTLSKKTASAAL